MIASLDPNPFFMLGITGTIEGPGTLAIAASTLV